MATRYSYTPSLLLLAIAAGATPAASRSSVSSAGAAVSYTHRVGALLPGSDVGATANLTTAEAIARCTSLDECAGFTFECPAAGCAAATTTPVKTCTPRGPPAPALASSEGPGA